MIDNTTKEVLAAFIAELERQQHQEDDREEKNR